MKIQCKYCWRTMTVSGSKAHVKRDLEDRGWVRLDKGGYACGKDKPKPFVPKYDNVVSMLDYLQLTR